MYCTGSPLLLPSSLLENSCGEGTNASALTNVFFLPGRGCARAMQNLCICSTAFVCYSAVVLPKKALMVCSRFFYALLPGPIKMAAKPRRLQQRSTETWNVYLRSFGHSCAAALIGAVKTIVDGHRLTDVTSSCEYLDVIWLLNRGLCFSIQNVSCLHMQAFNNL